MLGIVRRDPRLFGLECSRWTLTLLLGVCSWLTLQTVGGLSQLLRRLDISLKRGRSYIHSPDPAYDAKWADVERAMALTRGDPEHTVLLFMDEFSFYRQPTVASDYEERGHHQPLARRSTASDRVSRVVGALNLLSGAVHVRRRPKIGVRCLCAFWRQLVASYPLATCIYVVLDNWPVHYHPQVLASLAPQQTPWPFPVSPTWAPLVAAAAQRRHTGTLPIQLLPLPTYASWLNPIEKLWRRLMVKKLHLHRLADNWTELQQEVDQFLAQYANGSDELLRAVGLLPLPR